MRSPRFALLNSRLLHNRHLAGRIVTHWVHDLPSYNQFLHHRAVRGLYANHVATGRPSVEVDSEMGGGVRLLVECLALRIVYLHMLHHDLRGDVQPWQQGWDGYEWLSGSPVAQVANAAAMP